MSPWPFALLIFTFGVEPSSDENATALLKYTSILAVCSVAVSRLLRFIPLIMGFWQVHLPQEYKKNTVLTEIRASKYFIGYFYALKI